MNYFSFLKIPNWMSRTVRESIFISMLLQAQFFISLPLFGQTPFRVSIPGTAFSAKWQGNKGTFEDIAGGRKFSGNGGTVLILQANLQMHPSSSADHKMQRLIIHFHSDQYGSKLLSVKLLNGTKTEFNIDNDVQGDFTRSETKYNSWIWRDPISVSPQSVLRLEVRFPGGFEGPGSLSDFILASAEVDYALKPLAGSTSVTNANTSSLQLSDKSGENRKPITQEDKEEYAALGAAIAKTDSMVAGFRDLEPAGPRQKGFDMGIGITGKDKLWGPGKQWFLNSLSIDQQAGFKEAAAFALGRNNNPDLAAVGLRIASEDPEVANARALRTSGLYWLGFDIATGIFGNPASGALGYTTLRPRDERMRASASEGEHILLSTHEVENGFNASMAFHLARKY